MKLPVVALVGKPNVGKSSIFNRILRQKISIIEDNPGITRDRIYAKAKYNNYNFILVDTGGIDDEDTDFNKEIKIQAKVAIDEADIILFIVDGKNGLDENDRIIRNILLKSNKKIFVVVNKIDSNLSKNNLYDFYELGFENYFFVSAEHGKGFTELLDGITKDFKDQNEENDDRIKFCLIGRPNVGKSSIVNSLLKQNRVIVSDKAGTTRDSIDTIFKYNKKEYVIIDTAGLRKKGKIYEEVEKYSLIRTMKSIDRSDVCLIVIDAKEGIIEHDKHIASYALEQGKPMIILINKIDLLTKDETKKFIDNMKYEFQFLTYVPIIAISALNNNNIYQIMPKIIKVYNNSQKELKTSILNNIIREAYDLNPAPSYKGKRLKIYYCVQTGFAPIKIDLYVNNKGLVHFSYERYLENKIRENFDLEGVPLVLHFKSKGEE